MALENIFNILVVYLKHNDEDDKKIDEKLEIIIEQLFPTSNDSNKNKHLSTSISNTSLSSSPLTPSSK